MAVRWSGSIPEEAFAPRVEEERYGVYLVDERDELRLVTTSDRDGIGAAILGQDEDAREAGLAGLRDLGRFGLLDRIERRWIVLPWHRNEGRLER